MDREFTCIVESSGSRVTVSYVEVDIILASEPKNGRDGDGTTCHLEKIVILQQ